MYETITASWKCDKCGYVTTLVVSVDGPEPPPEVLCVCMIASPEAGGNCKGIQRLVHDDND